MEEEQKKLKNINGTLRSVARSRVAKHVYENHIEQKNIYFKQNTLKLIYPVRYS